MLFFVPWNQLILTVMQVYNDFCIIKIIFNTYFLKSEYRNLNFFNISTVLFYTVILVTWSFYF